MSEIEAAAAVVKCIRCGALIGDDDDWIETDYGRMCHSHCFRYEPHKFLHIEPEE